MRARTCGTHLEDCAPLDGDLADVGMLAGLGVRSLVPTYNHANRARSGCLDTHDEGLTSWGMIWWRR
ncbi:membrane dipeptidase [Kineosporia sp. J2-2]|uniref:Membrane dipeptidase n=1 Tax=Kineosporia corallincola TaxID=2835133 RepID=A0ABS5TS97_9ACTN|nr:membrane dipeptidase [Kineosporia corallincola]MBT0773663.1 membrane dipeptidase [Kineosporia corallincola]